MRIVVTGASGFLGDATVRVLRSRVHDVIAVARRAMPGSVQVAQYADTPSGDVLIHMAQDSDRRRVNAAGEQAFVSALADLDALLAKRFHRVVFVSSAAVYGDFDARPRLPSDPVQVYDEYTRIKLACEHQVAQLPSAVTARLGNAYGPGMSAGNVVSAVLRQLREHGPLEVLDTGPVRDFVWYMDVAEALSAMAVSGTSGIYNVGSGTGVSVAELARTVLCIAGQPDRTIIAMRPPGRGSCLQLDCAATFASFGWRARTPLDQGIRQLIEYGTDA